MQAEIPTEEIRGKIFAVLGDLVPIDRGITVKDIVKLCMLDIKTYKPAFNRNLYLMEKEGLVVRRDGTPPLWSLATGRATAATPKPGTIRKDTAHVFIDVDNSPCLKEAEPYATDATFIYVYASPAYNHHKPAPNPKIDYHQLKSDEDHPSAADVMFGMKMSEICFKCAKEDLPSLVFIVVSKDKILHTMVKMHHARYGFSYVIVQNGWEGLREYLE